VRNVVERALAGEREAVARYEAFAAKAVEEGYPGAAALFRAQVAAERTHAERFASILRKNDVPVPPEEPVTPKVGTTEENLRAAATAEALERDGIYREAVETCKRHGAEEIAKIFDQTRDSEVEHANLCNSAARNPASIKEPKAFYVCNACGYTTDVRLSFCPACQNKLPLREIQ
jgi:rubrerythrin